MITNFFRLDRPRAFTLVELLVVLAIFSVLTGLVLAATHRASAASHNTRCLQTLRQIGVAIHVYVGENKNRMPNTGHARDADGNSLSWLVTLGNYLGKNFIGRCGAFKGNSTVSYGWNDLLADDKGNGLPLTRCQLPSNTMVVAERADSYTTEHFHFAGSRTRVTFNQFKTMVAVERHGRHANYLFVDGHAESLTTKQVSARLSQTNTLFLKPALD